jgi:type III pantothenate kinase
VLIDFGTATTFNLVNKDGIFMGGAIMAGLQTGLNALAENTAQLPVMSNMWGEPKVIGTDTTENLLSGAVIGTAGAAEGFIDRIKAEIGEDIKVIATGGHAPVVLPVCRFPYIHEPSLLLEGLLNL